MWAIKEFKKRGKRIDRSLREEGFWKEEETV